MSEHRPNIPLAEQLAAVDREIAMRRAVYPHRIRNGKMTQAAAELEIARMTAVRVTLEGLGNQALEWVRFRDDDAAWPCSEPWPSGVEDDYLLVWNACDGFHTWWRYSKECPPGAFYKVLTKPTAWDLPTPSRKVGDPC